MPKQAFARSTATVVARIHTGALTPHLRGECVGPNPNHLLHGSIRIRGPVDLAPDGLGGRWSAPATHRNGGFREVGNNVIETVAVNRNVIR